MAAKKKKTAKKKTAPKRQAPAGNRTDLSLLLVKTVCVDGGPKCLYEVKLKGPGGTVIAGSVLARSETEAKKKAKRLLATLGR